MSLAKECKLHGFIKFVEMGLMQLEIEMMKPQILSLAFFLKHTVYMSPFVYFMQSEGL